VTVAATLSGCITPSPRPSDASAPLIVAGQGFVIETSSSAPGSDRAASPSSKNQESTEKAASTSAAQTNPIPTREPAQVLRIWIAPWEDSAGNLHGASHVFTEVVPRRWQLASATNTATTTVLTPLQLEPRQVSSPEPSRKP
jgi:conjugal transfer pilus assembly protein TraV